jgi:LysM repeat protein
MRPRILLLILTTVLVVPATASADFAHVVAGGETLSSVAAADGLSIDQLAAANGLATDSQLVAGATLQIPPQGTSAGLATVTTAPATSDSAAAAAGGGGGGGGGYLVQPGDTLWAIAAANGLSVDSLAAANGLDPAGFLISGTTISISGSAPSATPVSDLTTTSAPASTAGVQPTAEMVSPSTVGSIAAANGVSPSLAEAIGYQESGFNNALVSPTGATGVMQIEPGTWDYIGQNLATPPPLSPASAQDNVRGGVLLLGSLLAQTGGDPALAAAGYYQGLASVQANGMYTDTQRYVGNVLALRQRFGGP